jgi:hypothetical protein
MNFPASTAVGSYQNVEAMLGRVLKIVPYCGEHRSVWSPDLVTVMLEAGSQLDSIWRAQSRLSHFTKANPDIVDYYTYFGEALHYRWVVFWGDEPVKLWPFESWKAKKSFGRTDYAQLPWWHAFTKLKHDRLEHRKLATLENSTHAVAALFLAILNCNECRDEVVQANWLSGLHPRPELWLAEAETAGTYNQWVTAETSLFTYPVGWCRIGIQKGSHWDNEKASHRFRQWHAQHEQAAT